MFRVLGMYNFASTPRLLELCTSFFQKPHPPRLFHFSDLATYAPPKCLFQPPRLLER